MNETVIHSSRLFRQLKFQLEVTLRGLNKPDQLSTSNRKPFISIKIFIYL